MKRSDFGISRPTADDLKRVFETTPGLEAVWIFGSRARGDARDNSDIDLAIDAPGLAAGDFDALQRRLLDLPTLHKIDAVHWQAVNEPVFRSEIERDRQPFWRPARHAAKIDGLGSFTPKRFQTEALDQLRRYLAELQRHKAQADQAVSYLQAREGLDDELRLAADYPAKTWAALRRQGRLPAAYAQREHSSRFSGAGEPIPNVCLKVPTGGGKTLLAAAGVGSIMGSWLKRHTGLVLWVVPNEAIYRQTLRALADRDHPYRQLLNLAGAGRVKLLEKHSPLTRLDVDSHLCVMLLMLQSASRRKSKETLKFFRDRGNVLGFLPAEDDIDAHWALLQRVPNLDAYGSVGQSLAERRAQKGSIVKSSLGNVMRLLRPVVVIDEGQHAYSETALETIDGFNPSFMLELSATPRVHGARGSGSNILVDVRGTDLDEAEMTKLPIQVEVRPWQDWQSCLAAAVARLAELQREAEALQADTARYIRPMLLVQVERTGADQREAGFIHADDAKAYLLQLGFGEAQIAIKTSDRDDLKAPENLDLLSPACPVRAIITKQALQEGWDCPFAYVLCALAAGRALGAMTQLVGRILRLPHAAKTGRAALDACWVLCHDAGTGEVVRAIKQSLEGEGMGDLGVVTVGESDPAAPKPVPQRRRAGLETLRIFVPTVAWVEGDGSRRPLDYDSDVLGAVAWDTVRTEHFADGWAPDAPVPAAQRFTLDLGLLDHPARLDAQAAAEPELRLDRARLVRSLLDLAPNAWQVWDWVCAAVGRLQAVGFAESALARSAGSLIERLRADVESERDRLAEAVFARLLAEGRIEFRLRADRLDYELPTEAVQLPSGAPQWLLRPQDGQAMQKSLLVPAIRTPDLNEFELRVAGYLDQQAALHWWHRNVARTQVGLQGWKRHKVYPDFVFALSGSAPAQRLVLLETKGAHLQGEDTGYKQALLQRLSAAFRDERGARIGSLELEGAQMSSVRCDLVFDEGWQGALAVRYFNAPDAAERAAAAAPGARTPAWRTFPPAP